jgi:hypothetical protein
MTFMGRRLLMIGVACWASAACAPDMPQRIDKVRNYNATFVCDDAKVMTVKFTPFAAVLESDGVSVDLTQQPTADGFLYKRDRQSLHARNNEAAWSDDKGVTRQCRERLAGSLKIEPPPR